MKIIRFTRPTILQLSNVDVSGIYRLAPVPVIMRMIAKVMILMMAMMIMRMAGCDGVLHLYIQEGRLMLQAGRMSLFLVDFRQPISHSKMEDKRDRGGQGENMLDGLTRWRGQRTQGQLKHSTRNRELWESMITNFIRHGR